MRLAEAGIIDLDKPLFQYLPYPDIAHDSAYQIITARHVLSHQTGFPNWRRGQLNFINQPATTFGYSGEGFEYLKMVVEQVTGKGIEEVLAQEVLIPFDLKQTFFKSDDELLPHLSFGHFNRAIQIHAPPSTPYMAYSMHTNAMYFSRFLINLIKKEGLSAETYREMLSQQIEIPTDWPEAGTGWKQGYGLGLQLKHSPYGLVYGHGGRNGGFECNFEIYEGLGFGVMSFLPIVIQVIKLKI